MEVRPEELFELIHRVNPTGRGLSAPQETERYAQKAGLQSLLIRRFGDQHLVVKATEHQDVVSLVHRSGARDACHAVVSELEPDARSWVRRRLDIEASSPDLLSEERPRAWRDPGEGEPAGPAGVPELLRRGRRALEEFDYEAAEGHLTRALEESRGGADAAVALLELLVGHLGMDREALELEPRLSAEASAHPGVRTCLALAAARLGETGRALQLVAGTSRPSTAEVHAALAARAIRRRDPETAGRQLENVGLHDPTHPQIPRLTREIAELQAELQRPAEEALERRHREEGASAVETDARALLDRWPESEVARHILRQLAADRRRLEIREHLELGERAAAEERYRDAVHHFQAALDAGSERADLQERIERAKILERRRHEEERLAGVVDRFAAGESRCALLAYLGLPEPLRQRVRQRVDQPLIGWLEEIGPPPSGGRTKAAVAAVLALNRAAGCLDRGKAREALEELTPHREALKAFAAGRQGLREARSRVARIERNRARRGLEQAEKAFGEAGARRAAELLGRFDLGRLGAGGRHRAEDLLARIRHAEALQHLERGFERHQAADELIEALGIARRLAEEAEEAAEPGGRQRWHRRIRQVRQRIRAAWRFEVADDVLPLAEIREFSPLFGAGANPQIWLDDSGRELVLADVWSRWLFLRVVDLTASRVVSQASLRTPEPLGRLVQMICVDGDRLRILSERGRLLEMARDSWEVLEWRSLRQLLPPEAVIEDAFLVPGSPYLWAVFRSLAGAAWRCWVVDLRSWRVCRKLPGHFGQPVLGCSAPRVLQIDLDTGATLYSARGTPGPDLELPPGLRVLYAATDPGDGDGLWLATLRLDLGEDEERFELLELEPSAKGSLVPGRRLRVRDVFEDHDPPLAASCDQGLGFLLVSNCGRGTDLLAFANGDGAPASGDRPRLLYREPVPQGTLLLQDRRARRVWALNPGDRALEVVPLGPEPPPPGSLSDPWRPRNEDLLPGLRPPFFCGSPTGTEGARVGALAGRVNDLGSEAVIRELEGEHGDQVDARVLLALALQRAPGFALAHWSVVRDLVDRQPQNPGVALLAAEEAAEAGRWGEVSERLGAVDPAGLDDGRGCHYHHLLGLALLHLGRPEEAMAVFAKGRLRDEGDCVFDPLIAVGRPMSEPPEPSEWDSEQPLMRQLVGAIRVIDRALASGDLAVAVAAVERPAIWRASEVQSAARLAELYLRLPAAAGSPAPALPRFRKRLALAFFCDVLEYRRVRRRELDFPGLGWEESRLEEIAGRARDWLEEDGGG